VGEWALSRALWNRGWSSRADMCPHRTHVSSALPPVRPHELSVFSAVFEASITDLFAALNGLATVAHLPLNRPHGAFTSSCAQGWAVLDLSRQTSLFHSSTPSGTPGCQVVCPLQVLQGFLLPPSLNHHVPGEGPSFPCREGILHEADGGHKSNLCHLRMGSD
jgi:hypothetical protein